MSIENFRDCVRFATIPVNASICRSADAINVIGVDSGIGERQLHRPRDRFNRFVIVVSLWRKAARMSTNLSQHRRAALAYRCFILEHQQRSALAQHKTIALRVKRNCAMTFVARAQ